MKLENLIDFKVDLTQIDDDELEILAARFRRFEEEFKEDHPELEFTFQSIQEILRVETIARQAGMGSKVLQRFYLPPKEVFSIPALMCLTRIACRIAEAKTSRSHFGMALLMAILV